MLRAHPTQPRGSTLLLTVVLLAVLAVIGVAAVRLGAQERTNAAAKETRDELVACANAARLQLWAEISRHGSEYVQTNDIAGEIVLPDGTTLRAPAKPSSEGKDARPVYELVELTPMITAKASGMGNMTNRMADPRSLSNSMGYRMLARCKDPRGRELYVEFTTKFAL